MSPKFSDSSLPHRVPASVPVNHGRQASTTPHPGSLAVGQVPWLILIWHRVLLGAETSDLFVLLARSQHAPRRAHIPAIALESPAIAGISNLSQGTSVLRLALISRKFLPFSSLPSSGASCRCTQGALYGKHCPSLAFTLDLLCQDPSKHFHRQVSLSPPSRWHREESTET